MPIIIQAKNSIVDSLFNDIEYIIKPPQHNTPIIGKYGQQGTLNGLFLSGSVFLKINIAIQTTINAATAPKLTKSAAF